MLSLIFVINRMMKLFQSLELDSVMMNVFFRVPTQDNGLTRLLETQGF